MNDIVEARMQGPAGKRLHPPGPRTGSARFARLSARESSTAGLLHGCPVVTADGERIGTVDQLMIDAKTLQLRYVMLAHRRNAATVVLPWHALYYDAALGRLVFYTLS